MIARTRAKAGERACYALRTLLQQRLADVLVQVRAGAADASWRKRVAAASGHAVGRPCGHGHFGC